MERARRNIAKTISKHLGVLRKLKFKMNSQNLEKMHLVYLDTPLKFKCALLNNANEINIVPIHFMYGPRKLNVILTQLQCSASFVNNDLFKSLNMRVKFGITVVRAIQTN